MGVSLTMSANFEGLLCCIFHIKGPKPLFLGPAYVMSSSLVRDWDSEDRGRQAASQPVQSHSASHGPAAHPSTAPAFQSILPRKWSGGPVSEVGGLPLGLACLSG